MKMLLNATKQSLNQMIAIIDELKELPEIQSKHLYCKLNIGKHIRHVNDHFLALKKGVKTDIIDYNSRNRGTQIETNSQVALHQLQQLLSWIDSNENGLTQEKLDKPIQVRSEIDCLQTQHMKFISTIARELLYLINHTIHHAAHIALIAKNQGVDIPLNTGMAPCTLTFLRTSKN